MHNILDLFSVQLAQFAYPLMSVCAVVWLFEAVQAWRLYRRIEHATRAAWYFAMLIQFNWLFVLAGAPWWISDMSVYRPYIRLGWGIVALTWTLHTAVMIRLQIMARP